MYVFLNFTEILHFDYHLRKIMIFDITAINVIDSAKKNSTFNTAATSTPPITVRLSDLGGVDACIEEVLELIAMPLAHPEIYLHTGVQPPR